MTTKKSVDEPLTGLLEEHGELTTLFDSHQRALLAKDIGNAVPLLSRFHDELLRHIDFEENHVLPKYALEGCETAGGTLAIFQAEHRKLKDMLDKLAIEALALYSVGDIDAQILAILDQECLFKGLLHHHAQREQNILVPRLEARTTAAERRELLQKHTMPKTAAAVETGPSGAERFVDTYSIL